MTRRDFMIKWLMYALGLLPIFLLDLYVLPWFPILGTIPALLPVAAITVAVLEGPVAGGGFGLFVGILSDAFIPGLPGAMTLGLTLLSIAAGAAARYGVRQDLAGSLLCSLGALICINLVRIARGLFSGQAALPALLAVAGQEVFWSLVFTPFIYIIFRWVSQRVPQATVL